MAHKTIVVTGATGLQGGSVARIFLLDPKLKEEWKVRGVTRDVTKEKSKELEEMGAEMVQVRCPRQFSTIISMWTGGDFRYL